VSHIWNTLSWPILQYQNEGLKKLASRDSRNSLPRVTNSGAGPNYFTALVTVCAVTAVKNCPTDASVFNNREDHTRLTMSLKSEPLYLPVLCVSLSTLYLSDKDGRLVFISLQKFCLQIFQITSILRRERMLLVLNEH